MGTACMKYDSRAVIENIASGIVSTCSKCSHGLIKTTLTNHTNMSFFKDGDKGGRG